MPRRTSTAVAGRRPSTPSVRAKPSSKSRQQVIATIDNDEEEGTSAGVDAASSSTELSHAGTLSTEVHDLPNEFRSTQSSVVVEDPPEGFFLQGSSIEGLNGVYLRQGLPTYDEDEEDVETLLYYKHVDNMWTFEQLRRGRRFEWNLVDPDGNDRFCQPGRKLVPGAGKRFHHVHRTSGPGGMELRQRREPTALVGQQVEESAVDDDDELPWQLIALLDRATLRQVLDGFDAHNRRKRDEQRASRGPQDGARPARSSPAASATAAAAGLEAPGVAPEVASDVASDVAPEVASEVASHAAAAEGLSAETDHYKVLGVASGASEKAVSQAYRMASLRWHPDRAGGSKAAFQRVQQPYETLSDPSRRANYDNGVKEEREREDIYASWKDLYCPFGDPFERKRKAKKEAQAAAAEAAEAATRRPRAQHQQAR